MRMSNITTVTTYKTSDGKEFSNKADAELWEKHAKEINRLRVVFNYTHTSESVREFLIASIINEFDIKVRNES